MPHAKSIVFFHPDLGIGGAERLVIDAAVGLQSLGHKVTIYTSYRDVNHCFDEARDDAVSEGTLNVRVRGNSIFPASVFGRFKILFAILRHYHLLLSITLSGQLRRLKPDAFFVDQLSAGIPLMRHFYPTTRIIFYCHFPDFLLVQQRKSLAKRIWRLPFDWMEGWSMRGADRVVVNSKFTKGIVEGVWSELGGKRGLGVIYPCVDAGERERNTQGKKEENSKRRSWAGKKVALSINRFERKKDVGLAIKAFAGLKKDERAAARLVIAGGYDNREQENVSYHQELETLADDLGLRRATTKNIVTALSIPEDIEVLFLPSVAAQLKTTLLEHAQLLVYTPSNEHFGIVPLEAMLACTPVLAANTGGPTETVVNEETGWLRPVDDVKAWTEVMRQALFTLDYSKWEKMGLAGQQRVSREFSKTKMAHRLNDEIEVMVAAPRVATKELQDLLLDLGVFGVVVIAVMAVTSRWWGSVVPM
ncbi:MAG: Alpha-1,3-mannosyltransferase-like protein [Icmadophila ericetorum]|nr:Alpha-1,3-mannosyltransferase-like protein [Icmadophila ericetorum]